MMKKRKYKDWDMYIPHDVRKNNVFYTLNMKYDAGKKLDMLDKAFMAHRIKKDVIKILLSSKIRRR